MFMDLISIKKSDGKVHKNWRILVDEATGMKFTDFFNTKDGMVEPTLEMIQKLKNQGKEVKYIWCDNGGKNKAMKSRSNSSNWKLGIEYEFTARETQQHNHLAE